MTLAIAVLVLATLLAAAIDVRSRRIPNWLTGTLALFALCVHAPEGVVPTLIALASLCAAFALGSFAFSAGWFGGGDVKLIAACCGVISFPGSVSFVLFVLVAGAFLSLVTAAARGRLFTLVRNTAAVAVHGAPVEKNTLPYGVAIAAGSLTYAASTLVPTLRLPL